MKVKYSSLSIIIPAYNEENNLPEIVQKLNSFVEKEPDIKVETLIIDDGSTDSTFKKAISSQKRFPFLNIKIFKHKKNSGLGAALQTGKKNSRYELITLVPADGQFNIWELKNFLRASDDSDLVIGYRVNRDVDSLLRRLSSNVFLILTKILFLTNVKDFNWINMYRRNKFKDINIESKGVFSLAEIILKAKNKNLKIKEIPSHYFIRRDGVSKNLNIVRVVETLKEMTNFWRQTFLNHRQ